MAPFDGPFFAEIMEGNSLVDRMDSSSRLHSTGAMTTRTAAVSELPTRNIATAGGLPVHAHDDALVVVQREWNGWRTAMVRVSDLEGIHWARPGGAPRPLIHAHVRCNKILSGDIPHECHGAATPHSLMVCLLKSHTAPCVFEELSRRADQSGCTGQVSP